MKYKNYNQHHLSMKKFMRALLPATFVLMAASCTLDHDESGKFGGLWQLQIVDSLASGNSVNVQSQGLFWAVQGPILEVRPGDVASGDAVIFHYEHVNDSILLTEPRYNNRLEGDPVVTDVSELAPYGINALHERFYIENLSSSRMMLRSEQLRLKFRKF